MIARRGEEIVVLYCMFVHTSMLHIEQLVFYLSIILLERYLVFNFQKKISYYQWLHLAEKIFKSVNC
jgi:hypothetical protein